MATKSTVNFAGKKAMFTPKGECSRKYAEQWMGMLPEEKSITVDIEDTDKKVLGKSWMNANGNPCAMQFAIRSGIDNLSMGETVYYGKSSNNRGHLFNESELSELEVL